MERRSIAQHRIGRKSDANLSRDRCPAGGTARCWPRRRLLCPHDERRWGGGDLESHASGASAVGSVVVAHGDSSCAPGNFPWGEHDGMRALKDVLVDDSGFDRVWHGRGSGALCLR